MSFDEAKRERIKSYLLEKIDSEDKNVLSKVADAFGVSKTSIKRYLDSLVSQGIITTDSNSESGYRMKSDETCLSFSFSKGETLEDRIYADNISQLLIDLPDNVRRMWYYCITEMLNNSIDHSGGDMIKAIVKRNYLYTSVAILDNGIGAIRNICDNLKETTPDATYDDAYLELIKGRYTTDSSAHSGEGVFFTSRICDEFTLVSNSCVYYKNVVDQAFARNRLIAYATELNGMGTYIMMKITNTSSKTPKEVFDLYSTIDDGIVKTEIPLAQLCEHGDPVARSHAKRICNRLDSFKEVVIDCAGIEFMGQGFADEMFRVYLNNHPEVRFSVVNASPDVLNMIGHVGFKLL